VPTFSTFRRVRPNRSHANAAELIRDVGDNVPPDSEDRASQERRSAATRVGIVPARRMRHGGTARPDSDVSHSNEM